MKGSIRFYKGRGYVVRYYDKTGRKWIYKSFKVEDDAELFRAHLNVSRVEGSLDFRDYSKENPLGFRPLSEKWLSYRKGELRCFKNPVLHMRYACSFFGNKNIKAIGYPELEDFTKSLPAHLKPKTKHNILSTVHSFFAWVHRRERSRGFSMPEFPTVAFELGWRRTVDKDTQGAIIEEVERISPVKVWIGVKWLSTYVSIRPIELINIKEGDFDLSLGVVNVKHTKEKKPKIVPMLPEDIDLIKSFPAALPHLYFFRHTKRNGIRYGEKLLYKYWVRACKNLGIEGVDLYGGTRHSSVRALRDIFSPEQIKRGTMHSTNKAFERYFQIELQDARQVYLHTSCTYKKREGGRAKILKIRG